MKWSLYIGKVSGIKVFVHWTFLLLIFWITIMDLRQGKNASQILFSIAFIFSVFFCIILHEFGHALVAKYFHYATRDITLLPIGGMARMDEIPEIPKHELFVALAGPLVNIAIAGVLFPFVSGSDDFPYVFSAVSITKDNFLADLFVVNISLALFNLLPAFPMDGGRVFRATMSFFIDRVKATTIAAVAGQVVAVLFFIIGIFFNPFLSVIGIFIFLMAQTEKMYVRSKSILHEYTVKDVLLKRYHKLNANGTIHDAIKPILEEQAGYFLVLKNGELIGTIDRNKIIRLLNEKGSNFPLNSAMDTNINFLKPNMLLEQIVSNYNLSKNTFYPVIENEEIVGVVDLSYISDFVALLSAEKNNTTPLYKKLQKI